MRAPSLKLTFVLSLIAFATFLSLAFGLVATHRMMAMLREQVIQRGENLSESLAREAARFLEVEDARERELSLLLLTYRLTVGDVAYAQVVRQGQTVSQSVQGDRNLLEILPAVSRVPSRRELNLEQGQYLDFVRLLPGGGEGSFVRLGISLAVLHRQARQTLLIMGALSLVFIALGASLAFLLHSAMLRPLERVVASIRSLEAGRWETRAPLEGSRELRELAAAFNGMAAVIERRTRELRQVNAELAAANRAKAEFLAMIGHELKTPLHSVRGYCQLLLEELDGPLTHEQREDIQAVLAAGNHLLALIDNILKFTASGSEVLHLRSVHLPSLLRHAADHVLPFIHRKDIQLSVDAGGVEHVHADETKLKQVLINLLHNAVKYTPKGGRVEVVAGRGESGFWLQVNDTGPGIPEEDRERIFEPFERGCVREGAAPEEFKGLGLGLAVVRRYVEAHGGKVTVTGSPGSGSQFRITLPACPQQGSLGVVSPSGGEREPGEDLGG